MHRSHFTINAPANHTLLITYDQHGISTSISLNQPASSNRRTGTVKAKTAAVPTKPASARVVEKGSTKPASSPSGSVAMPNSTDYPLMTPLPPFPPHWHARYHDTVASHQLYQLFPVDPNTNEFTTIASLLDPALVSTVHQVVNPSLWSRFVNARKEMLKSKCNDLELLSKLELNDAELMACYQHSLNFRAKRKLSTVPFNDNVALLFHCTGDPRNTENILRQGLDERMGNPKGLLGRGIYFTDNPAKSINYDGCGIIFIFAVLLGDCLAVDGQQSNFVREPEKLPAQKRNFTDLFFDSIVGQPGRGRDNEYVIFNR